MGTEKDLQKTHNLALLCVMVYCGNFSADAQYSSFSLLSFGKISLKFVDSSFPEFPRV